MLPDPALGKQLELLAESFGYRQYRDAASARKDDQVVRKCAAELLAEAADHLSRKAEEFARLRIPPSTREQPFPPAGLLALHHDLVALKDAYSGVAAWIRALPFPDRPRMPRGDSQYDGTLLQFDGKLLSLARTAQAAVQDVEVAAWTGERQGPLRDALQKVEAVAKERQAYLSERGLP